MRNFDDSEGEEATTAEMNRAYWLRREQAARKLAGQTSEKSIARIHLAMAEHYSACANTMDLPSDEQPREMMPVKPD